MLEHLHGQDYSKLFSIHAKNRRRFVDDIFPPSDVSLYGPGVKPPDNEEVVWIRACELAPQPTLFIRNSVSANITPGLLGHHWLVNAIAAMTIHPTLLDKVVPEITEQDWINDTDARKRGNYYRGYHRSPDLHPGIFRFRFFVFGKWVEVVVDDYLPCTPSGELIYARSKDPSEFGVSLLEKAYAKLFHSNYAALATTSPTSAFVDLSGNVPEQINLRSAEAMAEFQSTSGPSTATAATPKPSTQYDKLFSFLLKEIKAGSLVSCSMKQPTPASSDSSPSSVSQTNEQGLLYGHSYAVTNVIKVKIRMSNMRRRPVDLVKLRNPWGSGGSGGFKGKWGTAWSEEWQLVTRQEMRRLELEEGKDGSFFMSFEDFIKYFTSIIICRQIKYGHSNAWQFYSSWSIASKTAGGSIKNPDTFPQNPQFIIDIQTPSPLLISIIQSDTPLPSTTALVAKHPLRSSADTLYSLPTPSYKQPLNSIGFTLLHVEENRKYRVHKLTYDVAALVPYIDTREIFTRIRLSPGRYVLFPTTLDPGCEGRFLVRVATDSPSGSVNVFPLVKDFPTPPRGAIGFQKVLKAAGVPGDKAGWVHPIGVFRVEVVGCDGLKKGAGFMGVEGNVNPYCVLKFMDMGEGRGVPSPKSEVVKPVVAEAPPVKEVGGQKTAPQTSVEWLTSLFQAAPAPPPPVAPAAESIPPPPSTSKQAVPTNSTASFTLPHRHQHSLVTTSTVKSSQNPIFNSSFMWAVRRPREASLLVEVWSRSSLGVGDALLGFIVVDVEDYCGEKRRDRAWEVCMPLINGDRLSNRGAVAVAAGGDTKKDDDVGKILVRVKYESTLEGL
ncbi:cysteine proteinase [Rhizoclosmatium globosum]|uniref:Cysteine proteinase n=1 Tax=Rhizoclosmatium globosum TaxID=329046 RepID=A0A1Y2CAY3_9FUNG|nr:cysteine proteinase [Rhizoclosmatium globosum]|eukprot:ORY44201.1 cysteine proteinase [Rhizoclosmatium globosum]